MKTNRIEDLEIETIVLWRTNQIVELSKNQYFCVTDKCYEIWEKKNGLDYFIKRFRKSSVSWVGTK